ncbi:MAG: hypothetical protein SFU27_02245 [Thermonemataceae bacterium]|nr:hypothetical protein [Thermonemataceae bacterium]
MNLLVAFLKNASWVAFAAVWLILNASYPAEISLSYPFNFIPKDWVLYASLGFVGMFNLIMVFFLRLLLSLPIQRLQIPNAAFWKENELSQAEFYNVLKAWFHTFMAAVTFYATFILYKIWDINVMVRDSVSLFYFWLIGAAIFIFWIVYVAFRFRIKKYSIWD